MIQRFSTDLRQPHIATLGIVLLLGIAMTALASASPRPLDVTEAVDIELVRSAFAPFSPLPPDQELHVVVDVEVFGQHDSSIDSWTYDAWRRWDEQGDLHEGIFVQGPSGERVTHIVLNGDTHTMSWGPENTIDVFDVPVEYGVWRRLIGGFPTPAADADALEISRDGQTIEVRYAWVDRYGEQFNYVSRGRIVIAPETNRIEEVTWLIDRPEQEPYPIRRFTFREIAVLPLGSSPDTTYQGTNTN